MQAAPIMARFPAAGDAFIDLHQFFVAGFAGEPAISRSTAAGVRWNGAAGNQAVALSSGPSAETLSSESPNDIVPSRRLACGVYDSG